MSLSGASFSVSVSHLSSVSPVHLSFDFLSASEYGNESTVPAARPYTPRRRGPSLSRSNAWHPPQRFSNSALPSGLACAHAEAPRSHPAVRTAKAAVVLSIVCSRFCRIAGIPEFQTGTRRGLFPEGL